MVINPTVQSAKNVSYRQINSRWIFMWTVGTFLAPFFKGELLALGSDKLEFIQVKPLYVPQPTMKGVFFGGGIRHGVLKTNPPIKLTLWTSTSWWWFFSPPSFEKRFLSPSFYGKDFPTVWWKYHSVSLTFGKHTIILLKTPPSESSWELLHQPWTKKLREVEKEPGIFIEIWEATPYRS